MALYNYEGDNPLKIRADSIRAKSGVFVWDTTKNDWVSLAESNAVLNYDYLHTDNIAMSGTSGGSDVINDLSASALEFTSTGNASTLTADQLELTGVKSSMTVNNQGITALDASGSNDISPEAVYLQNNSNQNSMLRPIGVTVTGADKTYADLESSFLKMYSGGKVVTNLSTSGLVLSDGALASTTLTPTGVNSSAITCSTINIKSGNSTLAANQTTLSLKNDDDSSSCNIQSSNISLSKSGGGTSITLDTVPLTASDITKLKGLSPTSFNPVCYYDKTNFSLPSYNTNQTNNADASEHFYSNPNVSSGYGAFNVGDSVQFKCTGKLTNTNCYSYLRVYLPLGNEFTFQGMFTAVAEATVSGTSILDVNTLKYPVFSVRRSAYGTLNVKIPSGGEGDPNFAPYVFLFDGSGISESSSGVSFTCIINIFCISNVNAYTGGTAITHN